MSLSTRDREDTRGELAANVELARTPPDNIARAVGLSQARVDAALAVTRARPEDVWLVRDHLEHVLRSRNVTPVPYSKLSESMRVAAQAWFPLVDFDRASESAGD